MRGGSIKSVQLPDALLRGGLAAFGVIDTFRIHGGGDCGIDDIAGNAALSQPSLDRAGAAGGVPELCGGLCDRELIVVEESDCIQPTEGVSDDGRIRFATSQAEFEIAPAAA